MKSGHKRHAAITIEYLILSIAVLGIGACLLSFQGTIENTVQTTTTSFSSLQDNLLATTSNPQDTSTITCAHEWACPIVTYSQEKDHFVACDVGDEYFRKYVHYYSTSQLALYLDENCHLPYRWWTEGETFNEDEINAVRTWITQHDATDCHYCEESGITNKQSYRAYGTLDYTEYDDYSQHYCVKCGTVENHTYTPEVEKEPDNVTELVFQVYRESDGSYAGEFRSTTAHACAKCGYSTKHSSQYDEYLTLYCEDCNTYGYCDWNSHTWESGYYADYDDTIRITRYYLHYCTTCGLFAICEDNSDWNSTKQEDEDGNYWYTHNCDYCNVTRTLKNTSPDVFVSEVIQEYSNRK